jgi:hypothetical protein
MLKRALLAPVLAAFAAVVTFASPALADSPHFVYATVTSVTSSSLTVAFKEAGLDHSLNSVQISVSATAQCVNRGGNDPKAGNKQAFSTSGAFGVSNGQATGSETVTAVLQPECSPPMVIEWSGVTVTDTTTGDATSVPGTFTG